MSTKDTKSPEKEKDVKQSAAPKKAAKKTAKKPSASKSATTKEATKKVAVKKSNAPSASRTSTDSASVDTGADSVSAQADKKVLELKAQVKDLTAELEKAIEVAREYKGRAKEAESKIINLEKALRAERSKTGFAYHFKALFGLAQ